ncbi:MAG TPA: hypothetical protein VE218_02755 [Acidobacteriaceae bacterium]|nr:hypothetical protein [Acidobacteriaceae bacterium]
MRCYGAGKTLTFLAQTAAAVLAGAILIVPASGQAKHSAPPKPAAKPAASAGHSSTPASAGHTSTPAGAGHTSTPAGAGHTSTPGGAGHTGGASAASRPGGAGGHVSTTRNANGSTTTHTASGREVTRGPQGHVTNVRMANGHEARFGSNGHVREVHANGMAIRRGPGGMRRTVVDRPDHSRMVAYGHGRGYIQRPYAYRGHTYYSRSYYYHGGYRRAYYHPYYYHGVYLHGYMPSYYYPSAYYGWAYNPWPAPAPYAWGWGAAPWYGYYGAYYQPYPVYPSAAYWLTDYMVAASLQEAYAAGVAAGQNSAELRETKPRLIFASYDPETATTSPVMTKEVKDAVSEEIKRELAESQKTADPSDGTTSNLSTLLADGQPHVFVVSTGLTVTSNGEDCGITEGDVLALNAPPAADAASADLRVLASKQTDCAKGNVVSVELTDLQEMHNNLLSNIDKGMAEMKDHPGQGGLPAPPAAAIEGTKAAPYAEAAPPVDPNGASELDQQAQEGAQTEQQVEAEANAADDSGGAAAPSPIGATAPAAAAPAAAPARPAGPVTIALGQTTDQVVAMKGQPLNKVNFPNKMVYIYSDMKIIFVRGKVSDVQ